MAEENEPPYNIASHFDVIRCVVGAKHARARSVASNYLITHPKNYVFKRLQAARLQVNIIIAF
ncbi:hypothetical protein [Pseudoalteromonas sp. SWN166]|uniref:hypothetical protein n=1 Tax=Pseudoalteromonas sp. SWN166 TaxID=2792061 RepID=UPI0018CF7062|nr:hypothetical protein [Pseudoalteromonas sp. SWN166]MBH0039089.1 hypothetical protein [Pseudoalteromonas sp. SWN166]